MALSTLTISLTTILWTDQHLITEFGVYVAFVLSTLNPNLMSIIIPATTTKDKSKSFLHLNNPTTSSRTGSIPYLLCNLQWFRMYSTAKCRWCNWQTPEAHSLCNCLHYHFKFRHHSYNPSSMCRQVQEIHWCWLCHTISNLLGHRCKRVLHMELTPYKRSHASSSSPWTTQITNLQLSALFYTIFLSFW